jgi:AcrR family transcriptional regulator
MTTLNKTDLLLAMAAHVRGTGLAGASLRPLARAAGTSDRMLIYHFGSKGALMTELLNHLATEMLSAMNAALPRPRAKTEAACVAEIVALLRTPTFRPYLRVWLDILSGAGRGDADQVAAARRILSGQVDWIVSRLPEDTVKPRQRAGEMLALVQGALVLEVGGMTLAAENAIARTYARR